MNVGQLISRLQTLPADAEVNVDDGVFHPLQNVRKSDSGELVILEYMGPEPTFKVDDGAEEFTLTQMEEGNPDDHQLLTWLLIAAVDEVFRGGGGAAAEFKVTRVR